MMKREQRNVEEKLTCNTSENWGKILRYHLQEGKNLYKNFQLHSSQEVTTTGAKPKSRESFHRKSSFTCGITSNWIASTNDFSQIPAVFVAEARPTIAPRQIHSGMMRLFAVLCGFGCCCCCRRRRRCLSSAREKMEWSGSQEKLLENMFGLQQRAKHAAWTAKCEVLHGWDSCSLAAYAIHFSALDEN